MSKELKYTEDEYEALMNRAIDYKRDAEKYKRLWKHARQKNASKIPDPTPEPTGDIELLKKR